MKKMFALNTFTVEILSDGPISSADLEPIAQFIEDLGASLGTSTAC